MVKDLESGEIFPVRAKSILNLTGPFADEVLKIDDPAHDPKIRTSQGTHITLDPKFMPTDRALTTETDDHRILFLIPWKRKTILVGTTEVEVTSVPREPVARKSELELILRNAARVMRVVPTMKDIKSVRTGIRPLSTV